MDFIDVKYINLISSRLPKFKRVKPHLYNFRCPLCGDSKKNRNKARGYFYQVKNNTNFKCHNCGVNISFNNFLKEIDSHTHKQYTFEKFKEGHTGKNFVVEQPEEIFKQIDKRPEFKKKVKINLPSAFDITTSQNYLHSRAIFEGDFYYTKNFQKFSNELKPNSFDNTQYGESRIVIPLIVEGELVGFQGRALSSHPIKYITIMIKDDAPKIYGLDNVRKDAPVYITEGPFDSTFIRNSVAMCGADIDISGWGISDPVWVYDNEPRSKEIVSRVAKTIDRGEKVVIWPNNVREKDINDMLLGGHHPQRLVESNTYSGLEAQLQFTTWKRI